MKKSLLTIVLAFSFVLGGAALAPTVSEAHGYVASPGSRAFFGSSAGGNLNTNVGRAQWEPQSIEAPKNTFITGKLASAVSQVLNLWMNKQLLVGTKQTLQQVPLTSLGT